MRWLRKLDVVRVDALLALAFFVTNAVQIAFGDARRGPVVLNLLGLIALAVPIAWRRRSPLAAAAGLLVAATVQSVLLTRVTDLSTGLLPLVLMPYPVAAREPLGRAVAGLALFLGAVITVDVAAGLSTIGDWTFPATTVLASWGMGRFVRQRTRLTAELHEQALLAHERREAQARAAVAAERRRIARELHDVVAHSMSVMVVQAGGGRRILAQDADRAREAATQIERMGRTALVEMRTLLGVLRPADGPRAPLAPQPTLAQLGALVDRARQAGVPVQLRVEGERRSLPPGLDLAAYRLVQEALTNVLKHAPGTPAEVRVGFGAEALELEVTDRGPGPTRPPRDGGQGLVGMRERVRLYGGELEVGGRPGGGFRVAARLPLPLPALASSEPERVPA